MRINYASPICCMRPIPAVLASLKAFYKKKEVRKEEE
jgi:hypothetical protein